MKKLSAPPVFESLRKTDAAGREFWWARELGKALEYAEFRNFLPVVEKAQTACIESGHPVANHFVGMHEMVEIGSGARREMPSFALSRYACYLIVQNGDPSKPVIAQGQTYFALQTRKQELQDGTSFARLAEDDKRLAIRQELSEHNKHLAAAAKDAGVDTPLAYAIFQDHGYKGLYGGLGAKELHARKGLKKSQKILDHMGSTELAANLFRATQTEDKLRRDGTQGKGKANKVHLEVGKKVRQTIQELGGDLPENLPTPPDSIRTLETRQRKELGGEK